DRGAPAEDRVLGEVHGTHAAFADRGGDRIVADVRTEHACSAKLGANHNMATAADRAQAPRRCPAHNAGLLTLPGRSRRLQLTDCSARPAMALGAPQRSAS